MCRAILLRSWGKKEHNLGLGVVLLIKHSLAKTDLLIKSIEVIVFYVLSSNIHRSSRQASLNRTYEAPKNSGHGLASCTNPHLQLPYPFLYPTPQ